jgi:hypothetical protein
MTMGATAVSTMPFETFLQYLRSQGFSIGVDDYIRIRSVLDAVGSECAPSDLKTLLCPLIARTSQDQEFFHQAFDRWFPFFSERHTSLTDVPPPMPTPLPMAARRWPYLVAAAVLVILAAIGVWTFGRAPVAPQPTASTPPAPAPGPLDPTPDPPEQPPPNSTPDPVPKVPRPIVPPQQEPSSVSPDYRTPLRWAGVILPLGLLLAYELYRTTRLKAVLRRYEEKRPPALWPIHFAAQPQHFNHWPLFQSLARQMRRRQTSDVYRLDIAATVRQTVRSFGRTALLYRPDSRPSEYLVLVDRLAFEDHFARLLETLSRSFEREGVFVSTWFFHSDPRRCFRDTGETVLLDDLHQRSDGHRLLVFSTGEGLLDPVSGELAEWAALALRWEDRAILTSVSPLQWTYREATLAREFIVLPATTAGLAAVLDSFERYPRGTVHAARRYSRSQMPAECASDNLEDIRRYLGEPTFQWLCASAVYPELQWHLTLHLGQLPVMPADLMSEDNLLRLFRLRYFREGSIPEPLRVALMGELKPEIAQGVRAELVDLLTSNPPPPGSIAEQTHRLRLAAERVALNDADTISRDRLWQIAAEVPSHVLRTETGVRAVLTQSASHLELKVPRRLRRVIFQEETVGMRLRPYLRRSAAAAAALSAWVLITPPAVTPTVNEVRTVPPATEPGDPTPDTTGGAPVPGTTPAPTDVVEEIPVIWTVGFDNTRQGWNRFERVLTAANVPNLRKLREFVVDDKVDVSPLVAGNKLYAFTMTNTAFVFDVNSGTQLARRQLAAPFDPADIANPPGLGMDLYNIYRNWGTTATPVIDADTNTLYVVTFGKPNRNSPNAERINLLWILDANTLADKQQPVLIAGDADNGGGGIANGFTTPYQKLRAGLGLLTDAAGNKAVVITFSINSENLRGPGHGFVVAYDVRGLNRQAGFTPTPAIWNVTPGGGAGGIWMSGSGPAIDGQDIYFATGNGMDPGTMPGNFGESFVKLRYTPGVARINKGKPGLTVVDFWQAFSDFGRSDEDQDLGAAGVVLIPQRGNLIGGGKDGILYNLRMRNLGKGSLMPHFNLPFVATYRPNAPNTAPGLATSVATDPNSPIVNRDRNLPAQTPDGKRHHLLSAPVYIEGPKGGFVYLWGSNERLRAYSFDFSTSRITSLLGEGAHVASGDARPPGGTHGGRLFASSNGTTPGSAVVWGTYPVRGDANTSIVHGALVAYDAMSAADGKLKVLFDSDANPANSLGNFAKFSSPVVVDGKVYIGTFSNRIVQYGLPRAAGQIR